MSTQTTTRGGEGPPAAEAPEAPPEAGRERYKVVMRGKLETLEPIAVNVPRPSDRADKRAGKEDMVHSRPVFDERGESRMAAYVPGHNLKGWFRASAVMAMADVLGATPGAVEAAVRRLSLPVFASFHHGGIFGAGAETVDDLIERRENRRRNALISLFGSMPAKVKGAWCFGDVVFDGPRYGGRDSPVFEKYSARRDPIRKDLSVLAAATPDEVAGLRGYYQEVKAVSTLRTRDKRLQQEVAALNKKGEKRTQSDYEKIAELRAESRDLVAKINAMIADEAGGGSESVARTDKAQQITSGLRADSVMELIDVDEVEIGFALLTFRHVTNACHIGARTNSGNGRVRFRYDVAIRREGSWGEDEEEAGTLTIEPHRFTLDSAHPVITGALAAIEDLRRDPSRRLALDVIPTEF